MPEEKESKPISRKTRAYTSLFFLVLFAVILSIWLIFFAPFFDFYQSLTIIIIVFLVFSGLAILPWLPVWFPREYPDNPPVIRKRNRISG